MFTDKDRKLISKLKHSFPLVTEPYALLADELKMEPAELMSRLEMFKSEGYLEKISALFFPAVLDYQSALLAFRFPPNRMNSGAAVLAKHPGISYLCQRDHSFSVWATLSMPTAEAVRDHALKLQELSQAEQMLLMPVEKRFKMEPSPPKLVSRTSKFEKNKRNLKIIEVLQRDLSFSERPYLQLAERAGISEKELLSTIKDWTEKGWMQPIKWIARVQLDWIPTTVMVCWRVPKERLDALGELVADCPGVRQCVGRLMEEAFPYTLYALLKTGSLAETHELVRYIEARIGQWPSANLLTLKEYKRSHLIYFSPELEKWNEPSESLINASYQ